MTPYDMDFSDSWNWKAISNPDFYGRADKIMPQVLGATETATVSSTQSFPLKTLKIIQVLHRV